MPIPATFAYFRGFFSLRPVGIGSGVRIWPGQFRRRLIVSLLNLLRSQHFGEKSLGLSCAFQGYEIPGVSANRILRARSWGQKYLRQSQLSGWKASIRGLLQQNKLVTKSCSIQSIVRILQSLLQRTGLAKSHIQQLDAARDTELFKNSKQMVLNGVLAQAEALRNFAIAQTFGQAAHYLDFTLRKQSQPTRVDRPDRRRIRQRFDREGHFASVGPDLSLVNAANTFAKQVNRLTLAKNTTRTGAKCVQNHFVGQRFHQHHCANIAIDRVQLAYDLKTTAGLLVERGAGNKYIEIEAGNRWDQTLRFCVERHHLKEDIAFQGVGEQVSVDSRIVGDEHPNLRFATFRVA
jgi:hypothetical protein